MDESIFKILGVEDKEDSYTNLISYAFNNFPKFKIDLLNQFEKTDFGDWIIDVRKVIHGRKKIFQTSFCQVKLVIR